MYLWLGGSGETLYVGKSINLRARMLSYLTDEAAGPRSRRRQLVSGLRGFAYRETAGELMALLLEDALIKAHWPRHNVRQRDYLERRYLLLTDDPFPTCLVVEKDAPRPGTLFGPFKDEHFVADLIALLTDEFGLRACRDPAPFRQSPRFDLGLCPGPCRSGIPRDDYLDLVERVRSFLSGNGSWILPRLASQMEHAAAELQFERAATAKERLDFCRRFTKRQRFIHDFRSGSVGVREGRFGLVYDFDRGALASVTAPGGLPGAVPVELGSPASDPRAALDRANVLFAWLSRNPEAMRVPPQEAVR